MDDRVVVAHYHLSDDTPIARVFSFNNLPPGSPARSALVDEYDRYKEALKGQGCQVHVWSIEHWPQYRDAFFNKKLLKRKS